MAPTFSSPYEDIKDFYSYVIIHNTYIQIAPSLNKEFITLTQRTQKNPNVQYTSYQHIIQTIIINPTYWKASQFVLCMTHKVTIELWSNSHYRLARLQVKHLHNLEISSAESVTTILVMPCHQHFLQMKFPNYVAFVLAYKLLPLMFSHLHSV